MERVLVLDTNVWISQLLLPRSTAALAVQAALRWGTPVVSEQTLQELGQVLSRAKFDKYLSLDERREFMRLLGGVARLVPVTQQLRACRDPGDDKFLDLALSARASHLITGDDDLLVLDPFHGVHICTPAQFLAKVGT
ncbi:putative toxin-antitoxin system toxin component, PIN family [Comamonas sp. NLF-1-9]|nr:putative toxin-antitoxin system toxin component, PIN family [Comamonas sp. NLF-1-9]